MLTVGVIFALVAVANAGYSSSAGAGAGLYSDRSYSDTYGSNYPYTNSYTGYASAGGVPYGPFANPYDFQNSFSQYYNSIPVFYQNLFNQQLQQQAAIQNSIQANLYALSQAAYGGGYGYHQPSVAIPSRFGGASAGTGSFASGGAFAGTSGGGVTGSYGGINPGGQVYGGTSGGHRPAYSSSGNRYPSSGGGNYASAGGAVSSNGHSQQHAAIYPANPARPNLDSRFGGDDASVGVSHSSGQGPPGFVGVSSFSSSSDINGVKNRESGTSVNKNGQVTTYYTRN